MANCVYAASLSLGATGSHARGQLESHRRVAVSGSPRPLRHGRRRMDIVGISQDFSSSDTSYRVPRMTVLGSFAKNGGKPDAYACDLKVGTLKTSESKLTALVHANIQAELDLQACEKWSGRAAMVGLTVALLLEIFERRDMFEFHDINHVILFGYLAGAQIALITAVELARFVSNVSGPKQRALNDKLFAEIQRLRVTSAEKAKESEKIAVPVLDEILTNVFKETY